MSRSRNLPATKLECADTRSLESMARECDLKNRDMKSELKLRHGIVSHFITVGLLARQPYAFAVSDTQLA